MNLPETAPGVFNAMMAIEAKLQERARHLAVVPPPVDRGRAVDALVCRVGNEEYAFELRLLHGVHPATDLTPVPCAPLYVAGVMNLRGEILTVLDLAAALGLTASERREVLVADTQQVRVGLLFGEVLGVRRIGLDSLHRSLAGRDATHGIAEARTVFLDLEALLADAQFASPSGAAETSGAPLERTR